MLHTTSDIIEVLNERKIQKNFHCSLIHNYKQKFFQNHKNMKKITLYHHYECRREKTGPIVIEADKSI